MFSNCTRFVGASVSLFASEFSNLVVFLVLCCVNVLLWLVCWVLIVDGDVDVIVFWLKFVLNENVVVAGGSSLNVSNVDMSNSGTFIVDVVGVGDVIVMFLMLLFMIYNLFGGIDGYGELKLFVVRYFIIARRDFRVRFSFSRLS